MRQAKKTGSNQSSEIDTRFSVIGVPSLPSPWSPKAPSMSAAFGGLGPFDEVVLLRRFSSDVVLFR
jgi:hypothetical protein